MKLIVGLGNPGDKYKFTRHNIGFLVIDELAKELNVNLNKMKYNSIYGEAIINGEKIYLVKPTTYMNRSGEAVKAFQSFYKINNEDILIITDDTDIEFSSIRMRPNGSGGSHNGLKNIVNLLGARDFPRLRIGIGHSPEYIDMVDFVLGKFTDEEMPYINETVKLAKDAVLEFINKDINSAMNLYNGKKTKP